MEPARPRAEERQVRRFTQRPEGRPSPNIAPTIGLARRTRRTQTLPQMSMRLNEGNAMTLRAIIAAGCLGAVLFTVVLSAIPQLHERIHDATGAPNHECAVTLLTSGNYQHTPNIAIAVAPTAPPTAFAHISCSVPLVIAHLEFSLLEHAPPAIS